MKLSYLNEYTETSKLIQKILLQIKVENFHISEYLCNISIRLHLARSDPESWGVSGVAKGCRVGPRGVLQIYR